ncbi:MBOAT family O-acyltransferase [Acetobacter fallax]|uniref:Probable alginate O-acetylase AlgI n=1 Tax=Acetobacter fallax TaxID=1737473 RepID=A0ABX0K3P6_9PROT|nr:MBOAT family protein [Acetobacter fallax]NHO30985.1 MBOAT family protein [Acetobacter fallax]NHO34542.1 MBOAT family protein [Acetobacter fallax]
MLFNSRLFILYFLPLVYTGFVILTRWKRNREAVAWLGIASIVFYSWWNISTLPILLVSIAGNFLFGTLLSRFPSKALFIFAIGVNLAALAYYKYTTFFIEALNDTAGLDLYVPSIVLPLAISFFTFQQIAYLSDAYDGRAVEHRFTDYLLFISFFPHLIAGPITHHREMLPQFSRLTSGKGEPGRLAVGMTLFLAGLTKKVIIADPVGTYVAPVFNFSQEGGIPSFSDAWAGTLSYAMQIYFDFSGYTDMAIGLGLLFGISLPPNFDSPFKSRNIIEFWSRWHMTLTRFLTAYIYNPLTLHFTRMRIKSGRSVPRKGKTTPGAFVVLTSIPTMFTMFVSGLWHGAGWQFIIFGVLHGFYLTVNHGWHLLKTRRESWPGTGSRLMAVFSVALTFLCVLTGLIFFRAESVSSAWRILLGMAGHSPFYPVSALKLPDITATQCIFLAVLAIIIWSFPNTGQIMRNYRTALDLTPRVSWMMRIFPSVTWHPTLIWGVATGIVASFTLMRALSAAPSEFLYFRF